jgi:hypothetical protein
MPWPSDVKQEATSETIRRIQSDAGQQVSTPDPKVAASKADQQDYLKGSRYDTGDVAADRAALDQRAAAVAAQQNIKLKIIHKNAPPDVTAKADGDAFKGHTMERSNAPPAEAPTKFKAGGLEFA